MKTNEFAEWVVRFHAAPSPFGHRATRAQNGAGALQPIGGNGSDRFLKRRRRLAKREIATFATLSAYLSAVYENPAKVALFVKYFPPWHSLFPALSSALRPFHANHLAVRQFFATPHERVYF